jgi:hypothetical protein
MRHLGGNVSTRVSDALRGLDRRLHIDRDGGSEWAWAVPAAAFVVTLAILVTAGVMSGVWAVEYIPTGLVVGLVIAGLLVACAAPEEVPPDIDHGDRGPDREPPSTPPRLDPDIWVALLSGSDTDPEPAGYEILRQPVGAAP